jgi:NAD(P)-dependent dehydrogenase (short-subunit alcohol dehydrogenase family)
MAAGLRKWQCASTIIGSISPQSVMIPAVEREAMDTGETQWTRDSAGRSEVLPRCWPGTPMRRPEEVVNGVVFLASPAASYITGANLVIGEAPAHRAQY